MVSAPPPVVQPPKTIGWPFVITDATEGSLLVTPTETPLAGAILASTTSIIETPPAAMVEGLNVNEVTAGVGGSVPPGARLTVCATGTSSVETPCKFRYAISAVTTTFAGALTTAVGRVKLSDEIPAGMSGTAQYCPGIRSPRSTRRLTITGFEWLGTLAVNVTSLPPTTFVFESVNGFGPLKQASFIVEEFEPVMHATAHAW